MILDTNALSAAADGEPRAVAALTRASVVGIPVVVVGEFRFGIALSRRRAEYEQWLKHALAISQILDVTLETSFHYAELRLELRRAGTPIPVNDTWIAAISRQHSQPILSRDRHFDLVPGIRRVAW